MAATILVVDDEKFLVEAICQHLEDKGYDVKGIIDAAEALKIVTQEDFDLVLTDLRMPGVNGMDIAREVHAKGNDTMLIILTGYATLDSAIESVNLDVYAYLNKPFELRELGQVVERALTTQRLERENEALHKNIAKRLNDVSTLFEVTRFLYDTDDWDITAEFVLDTLSIGLGLTHSCLLLRENDKHYSVVKVNFPEGSMIAKQIANYSWDSLDQAVSDDEPTYIPLSVATPSSLEALSSQEEPILGIHFTPIRYRELLLGYLAVFVPNDMQELAEDTQMLLRILATQIAPQVYHTYRKNLAVTGEGEVWKLKAESLLRQGIESHLELEDRIGVNLLRFVTPRVFTLENEIESFHQECWDLLLRHEPRAELHWLIPDTALAIFPGSNQVQSEITCTAFAEDFRKSEQARLKTKGGTALVFSGSASWPEGSLEIGAFLLRVWNKLLERIEKHVQELSTTKDEDN